MSPEELELYSNEEGFWAQVEPEDLVVHPEHNSKSVAEYIRDSRKAKVVIAAGLIITGAIVASKFKRPPHNID